MKRHTVKGAKDLSRLLGLSEADAIEAEIKADMMKKIRDLVVNEGLTHQEVSDMSGVGRTVVTQIVNCSIQRITIDRLIKVLISLGITPQIKYKKAA